MFLELFTTFPLTSFESFELLVHEYQYWIALSIPFSISEGVMYFLSVFWAEGEISFGPILLAYVTLIFFDVVIFILVRFLMKIGVLQGNQIMSRMQRIPFILRVNKKLLYYEERYTFSPLFILFFIKVLPLSKVLIFIFSYRSSISFSQFMLKDVIATCAWACLYILPGALVGYGLLARELGDFSNNFLVVFGPLLLLLFVFGDAIEREAHRVAQKITASRKQ